MGKLADIDTTCGDDELKPVHTSDNLTKDFGGLTDIYWVSIFFFLQFI